LPSRHRNHLPILREAGRKLGTRKRIVGGQPPRLSSAVRRWGWRGRARLRLPSLRKHLPADIFPQASSADILRRPGEAIFALLLLRFELALPCSRDAPTSFSTPTQEPFNCCNVCATQRGRSQAHTIYGVILLDPAPI